MTCLSRSGPVFMNIIAENRVPPQIASQIQLTLSYETSDMNTVTVDTAHFKDQGWVRVDNVVPVADCQAVVDTICEFWQVSRDGSHPARDGRERFNGIVPIHQHQTLWNTRQAPNLHQAFAEVHEQEALWVSMDRTSYKPRLSERAKAKPGDPNSIHTDKRLADKTFTVQGVLYLTDTPEDQGAWECVPDLYHEIREGKHEAIREGLDLSRYPIKRVPGKAGSVVIWHGHMPHGSGHNWRETPRFVQYITMNQVGSEEDRLDRVKCWQSNRAPHFWQGMPGQLDPEPWENPAALSPLGEMLLGSRPWSAA